MQKRKKLLVILNIVFSLESIVIFLSVLIKVIEDTFHNETFLKVDTSLRESLAVRITIKNASLNLLLKSPMFKFSYSLKMQLPPEECLTFKIFLNRVKYHTIKKNNFFYSLIFDID